MRAYQRAYLDNLQKLVALTALEDDIPEDAAVFRARRQARGAQIRALVRENSAMLRRELFPVLDDIVSADPADIADLEAFARGLGGVGADRLDLVLQYSIHSALVLYARHWDRRELLIRELYETGMCLFYMQEIIDRSGKARYRWKMSLMFGEAAAFLRQYDEIPDPETRGYIHRSMGNLSLAYGGANLDDAQRKLLAVRQSLAVLTDPAYHAKTPSLPWDRYVYVSHQERASALNVLRAGVSDPLLLREVMESAEYVREHQEADPSAVPLVRWRMSYEAAQFHCGIRSLGELLRWMEQAYLERDAADYGENGIYANLAIPALYAEYLSHSPEFRAKKRGILSHMYRRVCAYVRRAPERQLGELFLKYMMLLLRHFVEYPDGVQARDFFLLLLVYRDPDAYVRFCQVAEVTRRLAELALRRQPALLLGVLGCETAEALAARRDEALRFAYGCGLFADVGILAFHNMARRIGRSWLEEERAMFRYHVHAGALLLAQNESTRPFARCALGHHRAYDGSGGYPAEYDRAADPDRAVTDLVSVALRLVRNTDEVDPHLSRVLTVPEALSNIQAEAGTRFSPDAAALLAELAPSLPQVLHDSRLRAYTNVIRALHSSRDAAADGRMPKI